MRPALSLTVAPTSGVPIYRQLVDQIRSQIVGGRLSADEFLPSVRQVAQELEVNPMTVSKAYSILERDGAVELVRGQGMRVKPPTASSNGKARREVWMPLLRQVAMTSRQLGMTPEQAIRDLRAVLAEE